MVAFIVLCQLGYSSSFLESVLFSVAACQEVIIWVGSRALYRRRFIYPIDLDLMQSRWGVWVMIVVSGWYVV